MQFRPHIYRTQRIKIENRPFCNSCNNLNILKNIYIANELDSSFQNNNKSYSAISRQPLFYIHDWMFYIDDFIVLIYIIQ